MPKIFVFCDGGSRGNPGPAATGWVIFNESCICMRENMPEVIYEKPIASGSRFLGNQTNNVAEYSAVLDCIVELNNRNIESHEIHVFLDSELIVKQISGAYKVKQPHLKPLFEQLSVGINTLRMKNIVHIHHVPRAYNAHADALVNKTLDASS